MGYEIKILIGTSCLHNDEVARDKDHPFEDGSGFPYKINENGEYVLTGRKEAWFQVYAEMDLCKLGYQKDALNKLISENFALAWSLRNRERVFFRGSGGNTEIEEDHYGRPLRPVPLKEALTAMKKSRNGNEPYRRLEWAIALLEVMAKDPEPLEVLFYGH